jgi:hypothetical protein
MGLDVNLYAEGVVTDEELAAAEAYFAARSLSRPWDDGPHLARTTYPSDRIEVDCGGARYYGPGYERGPWPTIHADILLLRHALPQCTVHYGGDSTDDCPEATDEVLSEVWEHFLGPRGDNYRNMWRKLNARAQ